MPAQSRRPAVAPAPARAAEAANPGPAVDPAWGNAAMAMAVSGSGTANSAARIAALRSQLANNPLAVRALDRLVGDPSFQALDDAGRVAMLDGFDDAPNLATATFMSGVAMERGAGPEIDAAERAAIDDRLTPDGGTLQANGRTYTIRDGKLIDDRGAEAGWIRNDGTWQLRGDTQVRDVYSEIETRVRLTEQQGARNEELLDLHDGDPRDLLGRAEMNDTFVGKVKDTVADVRREGMDMGVSDAFRSVREQDDLYAKGRTRRGNIVTGAQGGESWHNYGLGADITFMNDNGQLIWPERGDYARQWTRYGEIAKGNGLSWGGDWTGFVDRPHVEYHPGYGDGEASSLKQTLRTQGLEAAWDRMGIGERD